MPFQVAYVIDPIQNIRGFFQWKNGKIEKLKGFYVYDDIGKPIKIEQTRKKAEEKADQKKSKLPIISLVLLCVCAIMFAVSLTSLNKQIKEQQEQQANLEQIIDEQNTSIKSLQSELSEKSIELEDGTTVDDLLALIESQQVQIDNQHEVISQLQAYVDKKTAGKEKTMIVFTSYTVQSGDTLGKICSKFEIDYASNINLIKSLNGIEDVNKIYVGQAILLPIQELN